MKRVVKVGDKYLGMVDGQKHALKFSDAGSVRTLLRGVVDAIDGGLTTTKTGKARVVRVRPHGTPATVKPIDPIAQSKIDAAQNDLRELRAKLSALAAAL